MIYFEQRQYGFTLNSAIYWNFRKNNKDASSQQLVIITQPYEGILISDSE